LYIADASFCKSSYRYRIYPCPPLDGTTSKVYLAGFPVTLWAVSVTNTNRSAEARDVRARVILLDASGNEVMNKVMQVATRLGPGQTTWLAPTSRIVGKTSFGAFTVTNPDEGAGMAVSGSVTVLPHSWARGSKVRTIQTPMTSVAFGSCSIYNIDKTLGLCDKYEPIATFTNPGAEYQAFMTMIFYGDDGTPIAGLRREANTITVDRGSNTVEEELFLPKQMSKRIAEIRLIVSR